ncbi:hypothetical protein [Phaffia rhodozyma]|uniref:Uncharacterized protein n=1 Tax=Phaffia rhodozyma TaxID=264483 RepID=A0A0F7SJS6_PHARH|nr:hypothetical protein [Phaffia rhodozyma]
MDMIGRAFLPFSSLLLTFPPSSIVLSLVFLSLDLNHLEISLYICFFFLVRSSFLPSPPPPFHPSVAIKGFVSVFVPFLYFFPKSSSTHVLFYFFLDISSSSIIAIA